MPLTFTSPLWLLLIAVAAPLAWLALRWFHTMSLARRWTAVVFRTGLIALVAGMLAGAAAVRTTDRLAVIGVVDASDSVRNFVDFGRESDGRPTPSARALRDWFAAALADRGPEDLFGAVVFDGSAVAIAAPRPPGGRGAEADVDDLAFDLRLVEGTNIAEGLRLALAMIPPDARARLVLATDGNQTTGDALAAAAEASGTGVPVDVLPLVYSAQREVMVEFVDAPPQAQAESTVTVRVGLRSAGPASGTLRLLREGEPVDLAPDDPGTGRRVEWAGGSHVERVEVKLDDKAIHRFRAVFEPDGAGDTLATNNRGEAFTVTPGRGAVLLVDGVSGGAADGAGGVLGATLARSGIRVETVGPDSLPSDLLSLHGFDLIIFENVSAEEVSPATQAMLVEYVSRLGGGFLMVGGPDSFGAGGWHGTRLAEILPVRLDLPEQLITPSAAIMIVLDNSGSMSQHVLGGSRTQQEIANESAALAVEMLDKQDLIGILAFNNDHEEVVPLAPNADPKKNAARVRTIAPGGGTNLYPALAEAGRQIRSATAKVKHIIVLSDGRSLGSPQDGFDTAEGLARDGITVSTIAVGDMADTDVLAQIARMGKGKYHRVIDPNSLPRVFIKEIRVVRKPLVREAVFEPTVHATGSPLVAGAPRTWPALGGLVLTQRRGEPTITYAASAPSGEPLLAHWNVGLGQVAAFTSDAHEWAREWLDWPGYQQLWTQIVRSIARPASGHAGELTTEIVGDSLRIRLDATDEAGRPQDLLNVDGLLYPPGGAAPVEIRLPQSGPGVYEAVVPAAQSGNYVVALTPRQGERTLAPALGGTSRPAGSEFRRLRSDVATLERIAAMTGGRALSLRAPGEQPLFSRDGLEPSRASSPLWRLLLIWCLLVFLLDVGTRRVAWDRLLTREIAQEVGRNAAEVVRARSDRAAANVSRLRGVRSRRKPEPPTQAGGPSDAERAPVPLAPEPAARRKGRASDAAGGQDDAGRKEAIREALRATRGDLKPSAGPSPTGPKPAKGGAGGPTDPATTSGLLAAKKRARSRTDPDGADR